ncbi:MAG: DUF3800 domain-containing protein [Proteobacteria bacterium]|nr:DUF3800 domain-containing protein [Pseudomonadota bacterium]
MYLCYVDESGTPEVPGNTSHFVLAGFALPISQWQHADSQISTILARYGLADQELHTAWLLRPYLEQRRIANFENLDRNSRRSAVLRERAADLLRLQQARGGKNAYNQARKNYQKTEAYIHLTHDERTSLVQEVADCIGAWNFARLFAESINKIHFDPVRTGRTIEEQAFEQIVSRFERYLSNTSNAAGNGQKVFGLLVHDNNQTVARKHTDLMRSFHRQGTLWVRVNHIIETPLFVDSKLTRMVQAADLCAYALRRFVEKQEVDLFNRVFPRADRVRGNTFGVRHYTVMSCQCQICYNHG